MTSVIISSNLDEISSYIHEPVNHVVIMISAKFCPPCKQFFPIFERVAAKFINNAYFIKANIDENPHLNKWAKVGAVPAVLFWKGAKEVHRMLGVSSEEEFSDRVKEFLKP